MVKRLGLVVSCLMLISVLPSVAHAELVLAGSDYLQTLPGTSFNGVPFFGVPFGPGNTDTIVERQANAVLAGVGSSAVVPIQVTKLNLVSAIPVDFGAGLGLYYITLQSERGGPASSGQMTINYLTADDFTSTNPEGTFDSFFDVFFDLHFGALDGPIVLSSDLLLGSSGSFWDATPPEGVVIATGPTGDVAANQHTGAGTGEFDFFPGVIDERHPAGVGEHIVQPAVPEPGSMMLIGGGLVCLLGFIRRQAGK